MFYLSATLLGPPVLCLTPALLELGVGRAGGALELAGGLAAADVLADALVVGGHYYRGSLYACYRGSVLAMLHVSLLLPLLVAIYSGKPMLAGC